jgi:hypothetical protein
MAVAWEPFTTCGLTLLGWLWLEQVQGSGTG